MNRSYLLRCGATASSSVRGLNPPIITFIGRLDASQKGFDVFLDAIELAARASTSTFSAWLIGGAVEEAQAVLAEVTRRPRLAKMHSAGRFQLWGRVDVDCLPELYSRSTLVVMPSRRETFGLVAVQAMLCHTPVAASYVGGLRHTVVHRETGAHFAPGDASALAFIIAALVNNRPLAEWLGHQAGRWASRAFAQDSPESGFHRILKVQAGNSVDPHPIEDAEAALRQMDKREALAWMAPGTSITPICAQRHNATFRATTAFGESSFLKAFTRRPDYDLSVYRMGPRLLPTDWRARLHRSLAAAASKFTVPLLKNEDRFASFGWAEPTNVAPRKILELARRYGASLTAPSRSAAQTCAAAAKRFLTSRSWGDLARFDRAAARLNAPLTGNSNVFVRCDPQVEIARLRLHAAQGCWPLSMSAQAATLAVLDITENSGPRGTLSVGLCHGDLTADHVRVIDDQHVLCDLEETRYAFGDLDVAALAYDALLYGAMSPASVDAAFDIVSATRDDDAMRSALLWLVAQVLHRALGEASWGKPQAIEDSARTCAILLEAFTARLQQSASVR